MAQTARTKGFVPVEVVGSKHAVVLLLFLPVKSATHLGHAAPVALHQGSSRKAWKR